MPKVKYPGNDITRKTMMDMAINSDTSDNESGSSFLMPQTRKTLNKLSPSFSELVVTQSDSSGVRQREVREKNEILSTLRIFCSHGAQSVRNRVIRNEEPVEILTNYGISTSGTMPKYSVSNEIITQAEQLIAGDAKTVEEGFPGMVNPTAEEIKAVVDLAKKELFDVSKADRIVDNAEAELSMLRAEVDLLIRDIFSDLNYTLRHEEDSSRRRIMRSYGIEFVNGK